MTKIFFDLDGTVYDLYNVPEWLSKLRAEKEEVYTEGKALIDLMKLQAICEKLIAHGMEINVISWASKESTQEFFERTSKTKIKWVRTYMPYINKIDIIPYGIPKERYASRARKMVLVDDNKEVRAQWDTKVQRTSIDANEDIIKALAKLLD